MIITTLVGGLGNQLFQYVMAKQVALQKGVPLKFNASYYATDSLREFKLNLYHITDAIATEEEVLKLIAVYYSESLSSRLKRKLLCRLPKYRRSYFKEDEYYCYEPGWMKVPSNVLLEGFWQHYRYYQNIPAVIVENLTLLDQFKTPKPAITEEIERNHGSVSVHIRRGDYFFDPNNLDFFGVLPMDYYIKSIEYLRKRVSDMTCYIFSDDLNWVKDNININVPKVFVEIDGGRKDYLELDAMSKCRHNIIANSSFSWWGAFLNKNPGKIIITPERWLVIEDLNKKVEIQLPGWIRM